MKSYLHTYDSRSKAAVNRQNEETSDLSFILFVAVAEDKMGWHAKVLPKDMAESVIRDLQSRILNSNKRMYPTTPTEDAPPVSLRNARMPSAPTYKLGEKVRE